MVGCVYTESSFGPIPTCNAIGPAHVLMPPSVTVTEYKPPFFHRKHHTVRGMIMEHEEISRLQAIPNYSTVSHRALSIVLLCVLPYTNIISLIAMAHSSLASTFPNGLHGNVNDYRNHFRP